MGLAAYVVLELGKITMAIALCNSINCYIFLQSIHHNLMYGITKLEIVTLLHHFFYLLRYIKILIQLFPIEIGNQAFV